MTDIDRTIEEARAEILPYESWEQLKGESSTAFSAFCVYRDLKADRNIRRAIESVEKDKGVSERKYRVWRSWAAQFRWRERAADYDRYIEKLKQGEIRKTIEAQGEKHRAVTGKMLDVVCKKLDTMNPEDLTQGNVSEWVQTVVKVQRDDAGLISSNGKTETKQGEFSFVQEFQGL